MFGAGLPVCALDFDCVGELVRDGRNGALFSDAASLAESLARLLSGGADANAALKHLRAGVVVEERWDAMWRRAVRPLVEGAFLAA